MANDQPTILVKKADGTFVRVPLSDLKKKPVAPTPIVAPVVVQPKAESVAVKKPNPIIPKPIIKKTPIESVVVKEKPADFKSLLEDNDLSVSGSGVKTSAPRDNEVDKVIKQLSFNILPSFGGRLRSVVQLRLKDVRGANETKDVALRSIKDGGLGLTEMQAEELEKKCLLVMESADRGVVVPPRARPVKTVAATMGGLPQKFVEPAVPANTTPFNSFIHEESDSIEKMITPEFKISSISKPKTIIHDVVSRPVEMGPVEEIKFFRLLDWRRMANNPTEAANRLKQKFINLKEESILLFFDAAAAWRESPLYQDYLEMIDVSFNKKIPLATAASDKEKITLEEIKALVNMEKELGI